MMRDLVHFYSGTNLNMESILNFVGGGGEISVTATDHVQFSETICMDRSS